MKIELSVEELSRLNNLTFSSEIAKIKEYALDNNVPIIQDEGLAFLLTIIRLKRPVRILEIGTAIGYSSSMMALNSNAIIDTIERDIKMEEEALKNIKLLNLESKVNLIYKDALEAFDLVSNNKYDLIFIDAAKAQYTKFFNLYKPLLSEDGIIVSDNMLFHGVKLEEAKSRSLRGLIRKLNDYQAFLLKHEEFDTTIFNIGDGMAVSTKKITLSKTS